MRFWILCLIFLTSCASLPGWNKEQPTISRYPVKADRMFSFVDNLIVVNYVSLKDLQSVVLRFAKAGYKIDKHGRKGDVFAFYLEESNSINFVQYHRGGCIEEVGHSKDSKYNKKWDNSHIKVNEVCF